MSKVLCSQVLWAQVFNLLWFNAIYWDGWRPREAGSWAERPTWIGKGKARGNHPIWCSRSDCWRWVISVLREEESRGKCFRWGSADGQQSKLLSLSSKPWCLLPFPSVMCWSHFSWTCMCSVVCCCVWKPVVISVLQTALGTLHPDVQASVLLHACADLQHQPSGPSNTGIINILKINIPYWRNVGVLVFPVQMRC